MAAFVAGPASIPSSISSLRTSPLPHSRLASRPRPPSRLPALSAGPPPAGGGDGGDAPEPSLLQKFSKAFNKEMRMMFYGKREEMWSRDTRTDEEKRERFDRSKSTLSWGEWDYFAEAGGGAASSSSESDEEWEAREAEEARKKAEILKNAPARLFESNSKDSVMEGMLSSQVQYVADWSDVPLDEKERFLSGRELAELCFDKYEKYHDMAVINFKPFGPDKLQVALNIYVVALGEFGFRYSEEQYLEKLDSVATILNALDQAWYVKQFLNEERRVRKGFLPSRPREAFCVSVALNESPTWKYVTKETLDAWFIY